jgi:hypothetical protein
MSAAASPHDTEVALVFQVDAATAYAGAFQFDQINQHGALIKRDGTSRPAMALTLNRDQMIRLRDEISAILAKQPLLSESPFP